MDFTAKGTIWAWLHNWNKCSLLQAVCSERHHSLQITPLLATKAPLNGQGTNQGVTETDRFASDTTYFDRNMATI